MTKEQRIDMEGFDHLGKVYRNWLLVNNFSEHTENRMKYTLERFQAWCEDLGICRPCEVTKAVLESYKRHLFHRKSSKTGAPLKASYVRGILGYLFMFFRWCARQGYLPFNPMADFELPKRDRTIIRTLLRPLDVERILNGIDIETDAGLRDRAAMETLYSTGMRRMELSNLNLTDLDFDRGLIMVRQGKGKKDRLIPIGDRALAWIEKYLVELRPKWVPKEDEGAVFLTRFGTRLAAREVSKIVRRYFEKAGITKGAAHALRHAMATAMLENGTDIRFIQAMLGHESIQSTQIYTKVSVSKLKEVHAANHPAHEIRPGLQ